MGLIIGGLVGALVAIGLVVGGIFLFSGSGSKLSSLVPRDVLVFTEMPSSASALRSALGMDFLNPSEIDAEKQLQEAVKAFTDSFKLDKSKAEALLLNVDGFAVAFREEAGREQIAVLIAFRDADAFDPWLASERITKEGKFGTSGERYVVVRSKDELPADASAILRTLSSMEMSKDNKREALVWFPDSKLLTMGSSDLLDDIDSVVTKGEGSLAETEVFQQADFDSDASLLGFVSPDVLDEFKGEDERKVIQSYLNDIEPFAFEAAFVDAGILTRVRGQLKGSRISEDQKLPAPIEITLHNRLPIGTVAYVAVGSAREEDGKALKTRLIKEVRSVEERAADEFDEAIEQLEKGAGIGIERVFDAIGTQMALGLVAEPGFKFDLEKDPTEQMAQFALLMVTEVGKEDAANDVVKQLRVKLFEEGPLKDSYDIKQQGQGFQGLPKDPKMPTVQVFFHEGNLLVGAGGKPMLAKALLALGGKDSLASDKAHTQATGALAANPRTLVWVDTGRIAQTALDALQEPQRAQLDEVEKQFGISHKAVTLDGDDRVTAAAAAFIEADGDVWNYTIEALNAPSFATLGAVGTMVSAARAAAAPDPFADTTIPAVPGVFLPQTGVAQCDGMLLVMFQCGERTGDPGMSEQARALETKLKLELADPTARAAAATRCGQDLVQFMAQNQKCTGP